MTSHLAFICKGTHTLTHTPRVLKLTKKITAFCYILERFLHTRPEYRPKYFETNVSEATIYCGKNCTACCTHHV